MLWNTGSRLPLGYHLSYLIEAYLLVGRLAEGLAVTREALARSESQLDVFFDNNKFRIQACPDKGKIDPQPIALHAATAFLGVRL